MAESLTDVDVLGVEFNHDVALQKSSPRPEFLIARNLSDEGHLSNRQGAELVQAVLARSRDGALRHVVLLHLSEQCNQPASGDPGCGRRDRCGRAPRPGPCRAAEPSFSQPLGQLPASRVPATRQSATPNRARSNQESHILRPVVHGVTLVSCSAIQTKVDVSRGCQSRAALLRQRRSPEK